MAEIWKAVLGFEGHYEVSSLGRVRGLDRITSRRDGSLSFHRARMMKATIYKSARYPQVMLCKNGKYGSKLLHILVCEAFHGPRPKGMWVRHLDGDCANPRADNLAWGTPKENMEDQAKHGTRIRSTTHPLAKLNPEKVREIRALLANGAKERELAQVYGVCRATIHTVRNGSVWGHVT